MRTLSVAILLALAVPARAEIYEIPLPILVGAYPAMHEVTFQLPGKPAVVRGASLRLVGTTEVGTLTCDNYPEPSLHPWMTTIYAPMEQDAFVAESDNGPIAGPFETIAPFKSLGAPSPTWDFLLDGEGTFTFYGLAEITVLMCVTSNPPPTFTVTGAWIRVDADIPVPAGATSWGALKAMYR